MHVLVTTTNGYLLMSFMFSILYVSLSEAIWHNSNNFVKATSDPKNTSESASTHRGGQVSNPLGMSIGLLASMVLSYSASAAVPKFPVISAVGYAVTLAQTPSEVIVPPTG